ncbi:MAG: tRNA lysidine(34) synthetase TilS [Pseudomonadota bacterium]
MSASLEQAVAAHVPDNLSGPLGIAVSGGGDSMALLLLLQSVMAKRGVPLQVATVDHRLRKASAEEAAKVADFCNARGVPHDTLEWKDWDGTGNMQDAARRARYGLLTTWAQACGIKHVALGHTQDDQAETVVMRLARGAGVDGLSAMAASRDHNGIRWLRPMLGVSRESLRDYLNAEGVTWLDDPSNQDTQFDRVRAREALSVLQDLGVDAAALSTVAQNLRLARAALDAQTQEAARTLVHEHAGALRVNKSGYQSLPEEIARRLLVACIQWTNGAVYAPRGQSLEHARKALRNNGSATLDGCHMRRHRDALWIFREYNAVKDHETPTDALWDGRWRARGSHEARLRLRPLGEDGLSLRRDWRDSALPRDVLLVTPAIWQRETLVAAPVLDEPCMWKLNVERSALAELVLQGLH